MIARHIAWLEQHIQAIEEGDRRFPIARIQTGKKRRKSCAPSKASVR